MLGSTQLAIVVPRRFWLEIYPRKTGKTQKERKRAYKEKNKKRIQERREMVSEQPSSTAEIR
jgi:hypothetical protein